MKSRDYVPAFFMTILFQSQPSQNYAKKIFKNRKSKITIRISNSQRLQKIVLAQKKLQKSKIIYHHSYIKMQLV